MCVCVCVSIKEGNDRLILCSPLSSGSFRGWRVADESNSTPSDSPPLTSAERFTILAEADELPAASDHTYARARTEDTHSDTSRET